MGSPEKGLQSVVEGAGIIAVGSSEATRNFFENDLQEAMGTEFDLSPDELSGLEDSLMEIGVDVIEVAGPAIAVAAGIIYMYKKVQESISSKPRRKAA